VVEEVGQIRSLNLCAADVSRTVVIARRTHETYVASPSDGVTVKQHCLVEVSNALPVFEAFSWALAQWQPHPPLAAEEP